MPINRHNCSIFCKDCGAIILEGKTATLKVDQWVDLPLLEGEVVTKSGDHHVRFRRITKEESTTKRHNDMILLGVNNQQIGSFTTSSSARQVGIIVTDEELTAELAAELLELRREVELRRRGSSRENG